MSPTGIRSMILGALACALFWLALGVAACHAWGSTTTGTTARTAPASVAHSTCVEDEPCWHWPTMGNRKRGIVSMRGTHVIVSPCRFSLMMERRSWRERRIMGWGMRGDAFALKHGCEYRADGTPW